MEQEQLASTPATKRLDSLGIPWTAHEYHHDPSVRDFGMEAARELGVEAARVFKTLIIKTDAGFAVGIIPVADMLDLKALASAVGAKRGEMAAVADAERITGYVHGGISPIGQRKALPTAVDQSAEAFETIFVSGGKRGFDIELAPAQLIRACEGRFAAIKRVMA